MKYSPKHPFPSAQLSEVSLEFQHREHKVQFFVQRLVRVYDDTTGT